MTMNYDEHSLSNRGNALPLYDNYLMFHTPVNTGKSWFKAADFNLQKNSSKVEDIYNRRINRFFLNAIVYDGESDDMQSMGLLTLNAWIPKSDAVEQKIHTTIKLTSLLNEKNNDVRSSLSIGDQLEARIYSKKVVNEDTDEYNVQIWFNAKKYYSKVSLHPLYCEFSFTPYNPHSLLDNRFSNNYERLTELFKNMGSANALSDSELDTNMQGYSYVKTYSGSIYDTVYTTTDQYNIGDCVKYINISNKDNNINTLSNIIPDEADDDGRIIYLCSWNTIVLKNGGSIQSIQDNDAIRDAIICPHGKDYVMNNGQVLPLMRLYNNWFPLTTGGVQ